MEKFAAEELAETKAAERRAKAEHVDARAALAKARRPLRDAGLFPFAVS